jgi:hypothetical protein
LLVPPDVFFSFIGDLPPRLYWLRDGQPLAFWDQAAFSLEAVAAAVAAQL